MAVATRLLDLHLLTWNGLVKAQITPGAPRAEVVATALEGENMRSVCPDPLNPARLYACSVTDVYVSEDAAQSWQWLPAGGVDYREIWTMAVHPTRAGEVYARILFITSPLSPHRSTRRSFVPFVRAIDRGRDAAASMCRRRWRE